MTDASHPAYQPGDRVRVEFEATVLDVNADGDSLQIDAGGPLDTTALHIRRVPTEPDARLAEARLAGFNEGLHAITEQHPDSPLAIAQRGLHSQRQTILDLTSVIDEAFTALQQRRTARAKIILSAVATPTPTVLITPSMVYQPTLWD